MITEEKIGLMVWSPLAGGNLWTRQDAKSLRLRRVLTDIATPRGVALDQVALAWVLAQGEHVLPIPGTKRLAYLQENVAATDLRLSEAELRFVMEAFPGPSVDRQ